MSKPPPPRGQSRGALDHSAFNESIPIFDDQLGYAPVSNRAPMPSVATPHVPGRALQQASGNRILYPPNGGMKQTSPNRPYKRPRAPLGASHNSRLNAPQIPPPTSNDHVTDSMQKGGPVWAVFKPNNSQDKEITHSVMNNISASLSTGQQQQQNPSRKRTLLEAAPIAEDLPPSKKAKTTGATGTTEKAITPYTEYDAHGKERKPQISYAVIIARAILESPNKCLTLSQIYKYCSDHFTWFNTGDPGWQNSIRHNLSLNKAIIRTEREKDGGPGKGGVWSIKPGQEAQFLNPPKETKKKAPGLGQNVGVMVMPARAEVNHANHNIHQQTIYHDNAPQLPVLPPQPAAFQHANAPHLPSALSGPAQSVPDISSDATIPLSDNVDGEDEEERIQVMGTPRQTRFASPLPQPILSSPPVPSFATLYDTTPAREQSAPTISRPRVPQTRKHTKHASIDNSNQPADSGYISSMSSSVLRQQGGRGFGSGTKHLRNVKGTRAEEEIKRIRNSSSPYDLGRSPTRGRSCSFTQPLSSSPLCEARQRQKQMLPPSTPMPPGVSAAAQAALAASASPVTNLELHRRYIARMQESPIARQNSLAAAIPERPQNSPGFENGFPFGPVFDVDLWIQPQGDLSDLTYGPLGPSDGILVNYNGSPMKKRAKNSQMEKLQPSTLSAGSPASALRRSVTSAPILPFSSPHLSSYQSPSKILEGMSSPSKPFSQPQMMAANSNLDLDFSLPMPEWSDISDLYGPGIGLEASAEYNNFDITEGFAKIGGNTNTNAQARPGLGRSHTIQ